MPIELKTIYTKELMLRFSYYSAFSKKAYWVFLSVGFVLAVSGVLFLAIADALSTQSIVIFSLVVFLVLFRLFSVLILPRLTLKKSKILNSTVHYSFGEDSFDMQAETQYVSDSSTSKYEALVKVCKHGEDLYLYISPRQACLVDLSSLSEEQKTLLHGVFVSHLDPKKVLWKI